MPSRKKDLRKVTKKRIQKLSKFISRHKAWIVFIAGLLMGAHLASPTYAIPDSAHGVPTEPIAMLEPISAPVIDEIALVGKIYVPGAKVDSGDCRAWIREAGITEVETAYTLIMKESGCRPDAVNPSSGACSLAQALPCSKIPGNWRDPINALKWMDNYCKQRYGSWGAALSFHYSHNWY